MRIALALVIGFVALASNSAQAETVKLNCKEIDGKTFRAVVQEGPELTPDQVSKLSPELRQLASESEATRSYSIRIYARGLAEPRTFDAVGFEYDVKLEVFTLDSLYSLYTYLDEVGPNDISSTLKVGGVNVSMSCQ